MTPARYRALMLTLWRRTLQYDALTDEARARNLRAIAELEALEWKVVGE